MLKGNLLFYFEKKGEREPLGVIVLEGCTIGKADNLIDSLKIAKINFHAELAEDGEQYCFQVVFHGINNRTYFLSAESQDLMERWMKALTCAGYEYMKLMVSELQRQLEEIEGSKGANGRIYSQWQLPILIHYPSLFCRRNF